MYYKVIYNGQVIDTLDHLSFVKYQAKHGIMVNCTADDAEGIVSSDGRYIWHVDGYYNIPAAVAITMWRLMPSRIPTPA